MIGQGSHFASLIWLELLVVGVVVLGVGVVCPPSLPPPPPPGALTTTPAGTSPSPPSSSQEATDVSAPGSTAPPPPLSWMKSLYQDACGQVGFNFHGYTWHTNHPSINLGYIKLQWNKVIFIKITAWISRPSDNLLGLWYSIRRDSGCNCPQYFDVWSACLSGGDYDCSLS